MTARFLPHGRHGVGRYCIDWLRGPLYAGIHESLLPGAAWPYAAGGRVTRNFLNIFLNMFMLLRLFSAMSPPHVLPGDTQVVGTA